MWVRVLDSLTEAASALPLGFRSGSGMGLRSGRRLVPALELPLDWWWWGWWSEQRTETAWGSVWVHLLGPPLGPRTGAAWAPLSGFRSGPETGLRWGQ